jgi:hypothetical protein
MAVFGNTQLTATKQDLIAALVQRELISAQVLAPTFRDVSQFAVKGAETISFPRAGHFSPENRASAAAASLLNVAYAVDILTPNKRMTVSYAIDPMDEIESSINVEADLAARAAKALGKQVDTDGITELEAVGTATTTAGAISKDIILEMRKTLLLAEADLNNLYLAIGPQSESILLGIAEFVDADKYGSARIPAGVLGMIYGVKVVMSSQIGTNVFYMYDKDGIAVGYQKQMAMGERPAPEYGSSAVLRTWDHKYGIKGLQNNALIIKDNN